MIINNIGSEWKTLAKVFYDFLIEKSKYYGNSIITDISICNASVCHSLCFSTEYDDYYDDEDEFYEVAETLQNDRAEFISSYSDSCRMNGAFNKFYSNQTFRNT